MAAVSTTEDFNMNKDIVSKDLKHYLHLYMGARCEYKPRRSDKWLKGSIGIITLQRALAGMPVKPVLRQLSDMTEEEFKAFILVGDPTKDFPIDDTREAMSSIKELGINAFSFEDTPVPIAFNLTRFLLSKHFDLFDLIPSGLAIDATTIKN